MEKEVNNTDIFGKDKINPLSQMLKLLSQKINGLQVQWNAYFTSESSLTVGTDNHEKLMNMNDGSFFEMGGHEFDQYGNVIE